MTLETTIEEHLEKTIQTLNKLRKTIKEEPKFVFALTWILVDKFIEDDETRQKLDNILSDNMRLIEKFGQRKYEEGRQNGKQIGFEEGLEKKGWKMVENLLKNNLSLDLISKVTDIPIGRLKLFINNGK